MSKRDDSTVRFKLASEDWEFEQVHRLNYQTFVEEIPQHPARAERVLIDRFHDENDYIIAVNGRRVLGMLAMRVQRPFSLDQKLPNLDSYLPPGRRVCELRLLAADPGSRNGGVYRGLINRLTQHFLENGFDMAVISGAVRQTRLYQHMGFVPFGPLVGTTEVPYQPMYLALEDFQRHAKAFPALRMAPTAALERRTAPLNFLPGPVAMHPDVVAAFHRPPVSHRSARFAEDFHTVRRQLGQLTGARHVQIMMGSGTLANDVVGAQISQWPGRGLVLSNGAFGDRLLDHAARFVLRVQTLVRPWGEAFDRPAIEAALVADASIGWLWAVHGETSTGMLNDLAMLKEVTAARGVRLCLDAVSSLGNTPVDLRGVALASGVSGKGLGSFSGLALVFHNEPVEPAKSLPRYLDLGYYAAKDGKPFTVSSNLLYALQAAVDRFEGDRHFVRVARLARRLGRGLRGLGLKTVAPSGAFPAVTTIALDQSQASLEVGRRLEEAGYLLNYRSEYLAGRNWLQVCFMGAATPNMVDELLDALRAAVAVRSGSPAFGRRRRADPGAEDARQIHRR